jgi:hypothetical protein
MRDEIEAGNVKFGFVKTLEQIADGFTEPLPAIKFRKFVDDLGLTSFTQQ